MTDQTDCFCNFCIFSKFPGNRQNTSKTAVFDNKTVDINPKERAHNVRPQSVDKVNLSFLLFVRQHA